uniref:Uncharacterized protein n=1 Tax=Aromatoleum anaerobium TaxID=182180 RepID=A0ABX1PLC8_9RHOO
MRPSSAWAAGSLAILRMKSGARVLSLVSTHHNHPIGENIGIRLDADHVIAFHGRAHICDCR